LAPVEQVITGESTAEDVYDRTRQDSQAQPGDDE